MKNRLAKILASALTVATAFLIVFLSAGQLVYAMSQTDLNNIIGNTPFYDPTACFNGTIGGGPDKTGREANAGMSAASCVNVCSAGSNSNITSTKVTGKNVRDMFVFIAKNIFPKVTIVSAYAAAGGVGNLMRESGVTANPPPTPPSNPARGLVQWQGSRLPAMRAWVTAEGKNRLSLDGQRDFMIHELHTDYKNVTNKLKNATSAKKAAFIWGRFYEGFDERDGSMSIRENNAIDVYNKYKDLVKNGGDSSGGNITSAPVPSGSSCPGSSSPDCNGATGDTKILCEAQKYKGFYYRWGAGHAGFKNFIAGCPNPKKMVNQPNNKPHSGPDSHNGNPSPCATDCSSLVSIAVDEAFGKNYMWSVSEGNGAMQGPGASNWKHIPISKARGGDIVTHPGHVEIVDHVKGGTVYTFGSHHTGAKTGPKSSAASYWSSGAWHWTGPGSGS